MNIRKTGTDTQTSLGASGTGAYIRKCGTLVKEAPGYPSF